MQENKTKAYYSSPLLTAEKGVVLIVALVMLLVMTVVGVTTMTGATLQERIAGNQRQKAISRSNASMALNTAEAFLTGFHTGRRNISEPQIVATFTGNGLYVQSLLDGSQNANFLAFDRLDDTAWVNANSVAVTDNNQVLRGRYIIEYLGGYDPTNISRSDDRSGDNSPGGGSGTEGFRKVFRLTAIGFGNNANIISMLESYYLEASKQ